MESSAKDRFVAVKDLEGKSRRMLLPRQHDGGWPYSREMLDQIAQDERSVLITGESGTGKELLAYYLHGKSRRSTRPLVAVNCSGFTEERMQGELFGWKKGAFTGATSDYKGRVREAEEGTLFLDEIGNMDRANQARLLRFMQTGETEPLGAPKHRANVRVIAATNKLAGGDANTSVLIPDLYHRFRFNNLYLPALRDRQSDIFRLLLEPDFLGTDAPFTGTTIPTLLMLAAQDWAGNIREFRKYCEDRRVFHTFENRHVCAHHKDRYGEIRNSPFPNYVFHDCEFSRDATHVMGTLDMCLQAAEKGIEHLVSGGGTPPPSYLRTLSLLWILNSAAFSFRNAPMNVSSDAIVPFEAIRDELAVIDGIVFGSRQTEFKFDFILSCMNPKMRWPINFGQKHCRWLYAVLHLGYFCRTRTENAPSDGTGDGRDFLKALQSRPRLKDKFRLILEDLPCMLPKWEAPRPPVQEALDSQIQEKLSHLDLSRSRKYEANTIKQVLLLHHKGFGSKAIVTQMTELNTSNEVRHLVRTYGRGFEPLKKNKGGRPSSKKTCA